MCFEVRPPRGSIPMLIGRAPPTEKNTPGNCLTWLVLTVGLARKPRNTMTMNQTQERPNLETVRENTCDCCQCTAPVKCAWPDDWNPHGKETPQPHANEVDPSYCDRESEHQALAQQLEWVECRWLPWASAVSQEKTGASTVVTATVRLSIYLVGVDATGL